MSCEALSLRVTGARSVLAGGKGYFVYTITVRRGDECWEVHRRFSSIHAFSQSVLYLCTPFEATLVPSKHPLASRADPVSVVKVRTRELQMYFNVIAQNPAVRASSLLTSFLDPLCHPALCSLLGSGGGPLKEGALEVQSKSAVRKLLSRGKNAAWRDRWAVLSELTLSLHLFKSREALSVESEAMQLEFCSVEAVSQSPCCFVISRWMEQTKAGADPPPVLRAESSAECGAWIKAIRIAISMRQAKGCSAITPAKLPEHLVSRCQPDAVTKGGPITPARSAPQRRESHSRTRSKSFDGGDSPLKVIVGTPAVERQRAPQAAGLHKSASFEDLGTPTRRCLEEAEEEQDDERDDDAVEEESGSFLSDSDGTDGFTFLNGGATMTAAELQVRQGIQMTRFSTKPRFRQRTPPPQAALQTKATLSLLPGEKISCSFEDYVVHVHIHDRVSATPAKGVVGSLWVTNYRLVFKPTLSGDGPPKRGDPCSGGFDIPIASIQRVEKCRSALAEYGRFWCVLLQTKDFHEVRLSFLCSNVSGTAPEAALEEALMVDTLPKLFAFSPEWVASFDEETVKRGWSVYDPEQEFSRLGIPDAKWRISTLNQGYRFCLSYPEALAVPAGFPDKDLPAVFAFRSKGRIPVLSWRNRANGASLLRCGQPSVGLTSQRCAADERFLGLVAGSVAILDARPRLNARANQLWGKGFEATSNYSNCTSVVFLGIANIHKMQQSIKKLRKLCLTEPSDPSLVPESPARGSRMTQLLADPQPMTPQPLAYATVMRKLASSRWLPHVQAIMSGALDVARRVSSGQTVLVHCSDGWDRTPQLTCLAMIMMDPFYRTLRGFEILVEKEWVSYGHMFGKRTRHVNALAAPPAGSATGTVTVSITANLTASFATQQQGPVFDDPSPEQSPVFLQFVDCVWQLLSHLPDGTFQFTEQFLIDLLDELHACKFGTFLFDSLAERDTAHTVPFWAVANTPESVAKYSNPRYSEGSSAATSNLVDVIQSTKGILLTLWDSYYLRWRRFHDSHEPGSPLDSALREHGEWLFTQ